MKYKIIFTFIIVSVIFVSCQQISKTSAQAKENEQQNTLTYKDITASEFDAIAKAPNALVIDVRTPEEVSEGKIQEADLFIDFTSDDFEAKIDSLDKNKTYIVYCKSGGRSAQAAQIMIDKGFKNVYNLQGGISSYQE